LQLLVAFGKKATQLCPCGYLGDPQRHCRCTPDQVARYRARISGPLLDRIDLQVQVPRVPPRDLIAPGGRGESSAEVRGRVIACRERQLARQDRANALLRAEQLSGCCALGAAETAFLDRAATELHLSARALHRALRVARTIADLGAEDTVSVTHLAEALGYRIPW